MEVPELNATVLADRCENSCLVATPFDIDDLIVDIQALE